MQAKTFFGFEPILAKELSELGAADVKIKNRLVEFYGDLGFLYKANYSLRTALRILKPIGSFQVYNEDDLYQKCKQFHWENYLDANKSFMIHATIHSEQFNHSQYAALRVKDALVDRFKEKSGKRPDVDRRNPDVVINLHISHNKVSLSLDSSGEPLFKRGYRKETGDAPLNEVMAAGLLKMAGWDGKGNFLDPMCGSGTLLIEAAMIAANIPAQLHRRSFAFQNWKDYDEKLFTKIRNVRLDRVRDFHGKIVGYDNLPMMVKISQMNIKNADLTEFIEVYPKDFFQSKKELAPLLIVFNPPYDERMRIKAEDFYEQIGNTLKHGYPNTLAWFITSDMEAVKQVGLRPSKKIKLFNGKLECKYLQYELYEGTKKNKG